MITETCSTIHLLIRYHAMPWFHDRSEITRWHYSCDLHANLVWNIYILRSSVNSYIEMISQSFGSANCEVRLIRNSPVRLICYLPCIAELL